MGLGYCRLRDRREFPETDSSWFHDQQAALDLVRLALLERSEKGPAKSVARDLVRKARDDNAVSNRDREAEDVAEGQVGRDYRRPVSLGVPGDVIVGSPPQTNVSNVLDIETVGTEQSGQGSRQILVNEKPRGLPHGSNLLVA